MEMCDPTVSPIFIHELANVHTSNIGIKTNVWQHTIILGGAIIGINCNICSHCFIENNVTIGNNVTIKNGSLLYDGLIIEDDVFIGPNVIFTNDFFPRSKNFISQYPLTVVQKGASIGAGSIILPGIIIGENSMIGAGSVVTKNVESRTVVFGNPAKFIRKIVNC